MSKFQYQLRKNQTIEITGYTDYGEQELIIPASIDGYIVTSISIENIDYKGNNAFFNVSPLKKVILPDTLKMIGEQGLSELSFKEIVLPKSLEIIRPYAFCNCTNLEFIIIPGSVTTIRQGTFQYCHALKNIILPHALEKIENHAFSGCQSLHTIDIPNNVEVIEHHAFYECFRLESISIPNGVNHIGISAFDGCESLNMVDLPSTLEYIGSKAFYRCVNLETINISLENPHFASMDGVLYDKDIKHLIQYPSAKEDEIFVVPSTVTHICESAFTLNYKIKEIILPDSLEVIDALAFSGCCELESMKLPEHLKSIGDFAFDSCYKIVLDVYKDSFGLKYCQKNGYDYRIIEEI